LGPKSDIQNPEGNVFEAKCDTRVKSRFDHFILKSIGVESVIEKMRVQIFRDKRLRKRIAELEKKLLMSQEQI
jgi:hypothetical protein